MRVKSSIASFTPAACAIASRCSTALVDPPSAMTVVIAFSNALLRQDVARADAALDAARTTAAPARAQSSRLSSEMAACAELFGRLSPSASIAEAIVFAVYMPPHDPAPGQACCLEIRQLGVVELARRVLPDRLERPRRCRTGSLCDQMPGRIVPP